MRITDNVINYPNCACGHKLTAHLQFNNTTRQWEVAACTKHACACTEFTEALEA